MIDPEAQHLLTKFKSAWNKATHAESSSDESFEAKCDYRDIAVELALLLMTSPTPTETITDLDPAIWGNSPDGECENPDTPELPHSVRAIVREIHRAAQQSRRTNSASNQTLLYIELKEKEGLAIRTKDRQLKSTLYHVKAMRISTKSLEQKITRIEQICAMALNLPFQAVQS